MDDMSFLQRLVAALLVSLLATAGIVIVGGWLLGQIHSSKGRSQSAPEAGSIEPHQRHATAPAR